MRKRYRNRYVLNKMIRVVSLCNQIMHLSGEGVKEQTSFGDDSLLVVQPSPVCNNNKLIRYFLFSVRE